MVGLRRRPARSGMRVALPPAHTIATPAAATRASVTRRRTPGAARHTRPRRSSRPLPPRPPAAARAGSGWVSEGKRSMRRALAAQSNPLSVDELSPESSSLSGSIVVAILRRLSLDELCRLVLVGGLI